MKIINKVLLALALTNNPVHAMIRRLVRGTLELHNTENPPANMLKRTIEAFDDQLSIITSGTMNTTFSEDLNPLCQEMPEIYKHLQLELPEFTPKGTMLGQNEDELYLTILVGNTEIYYNTKTDSIVLSKGESEDHIIKCYVFLDANGNIIIHIPSYPDNNNKWISLNKSNNFENLVVNGLHFALPLMLEGVVESIIKTGKVRGGIVAIGLIGRSKETTPNLGIKCLTELSNFNPESDVIHFAALDGYGTLHIFNLLTGVIFRQSPTHGFINYFMQRIPPASLDSLNEQPSLTDFKTFINNIESDINDPKIYNKLNISNTINTDMTWLDILLALKTKVIGNKKEELQDLLLSCIPKGLGQFAIINTEQHEEFLNNIEARLHGSKEALKDVPIQDGDPLKQIINKYLRCLRTHDINFDASSSGIIQSDQPTLMIIRMKFAMGLLPFRSTSDFKWEVAPKYIKEYYQSPNFNPNNEKIFVDYLKKTGHRAYDLITIISMISDKNELSTKMIEALSGEVFNRLELNKTTDPIQQALCALRKLKEAKNLALWFSEESSQTPSEAFQGLGLPYSIFQKNIYFGEKEDPTRDVSELIGGIYNAMVQKTPKISPYLHIYIAMMFVREYCELVENLQEKQVSKREKFRMFSSMTKSPKKSMPDSSPAASSGVMVQFPLEQELNQGKSSKAKKI